MKVADSMFQRVGLHRPISRWKSRGQTWSLGLGLTFSKLIFPYLIYSLSEGHGFPTWDMLVETLIPFTGHKDTQKSTFVLKPFNSHVLKFEVEWETFPLIAPVVKDEEVQKSCSEASNEAGGSGKGEVKEMNTVCGGSSPRDHAIKTTGPNYTIPHREWTPLLCPPPP